MQSALRFVLIGLLSACASAAPYDASGPIVESAPQSAEPSATSPNAGTTTPVRKSETESRLIYSRGVAGPDETTGTGARAYAVDAIRLNFVDAQAADAARALVAEALGETLIVAAGVRDSRITLVSPQPVPTRAALEALESALAESGLTLLEREDGYALTTLADASGASKPANRGFGYTVVIEPVRNATPSEILSFVRPFVSSRIVMTAADDQSVVVIEGPAADVKAAREAIGVFDAPYLTDRFYGLFEVRETSADDLQIELEAVLSRTGDAPGAEILALPRLNLLFVVARERGHFAAVERWVARLDRRAGGDERRLRYYLAQNTNAEVLASQLGALFAGGQANLVNPAQSNSVVNPSTSNSFRTAVPRGGGDLSAPRTGLAGVSERTTGAAAAQGVGAGDGVAIIPDILNNALIIRANDAEYREITDLLMRMDQQAPQVLIEATIAEVTLNDSLRYGVRWFFDNAESGVSFSGGEVGSAAEIFPGFNYSFIDGDFRVALDALETVSDVTVLSAPSIMVQNNQTANLQVGDQVPVATQTAQSLQSDDAPVLTTIQFLDTGVILEVRPRINAADNVVLEISQEVSDAVETTTAGIDTFLIQQRRFTSTVTVADGEAVALGGLIRQTDTENDSGIPFIRRIPILGRLFASTTIATRRTELIVFLTPRIVRDQSAAAEELQRLRSTMPALIERLEQMELLN